MPLLRSSLHSLQTHEFPLHKNAMWVLLTRLYFFCPLLHSLSVAKVFCCPFCNSNLNTLFLSFFLSSMVSGGTGGGVVSCCFRLFSLLFLVFYFFIPRPLLLLLLLWVAVPKDNYADACTEVTWSAV